MGRPQRAKGMIGAREERFLALLFMGLAVLLWGVSFISTKVVLTEISPITIAFFRQIIAISALIPIALALGYLPRVPIKDVMAMAAAGFFGTVAYFIFENTGLQYTTASNASMVVSALPAMTLLVDALLFKAKVTWKMLPCMAFSAVGVYLVVTVDGRLDLSSSRIYGNLLILGAMICWVVYNVLNLGVSERYSSVTITAYQAITSAFLFLPFVFMEVSTWRPLSEVSIGVLAHLAFLGIFCSASAYFFYIYASRRLGMTVSSAALNLIPAVTAVFGYAVLQERLSPIQVCGMILIASALIALSRLTPGPSQRPNSMEDK